MLASCSTELKLHNCLTGNLESSYHSCASPKEPIVDISWSFDDSHIVLLTKNGNAEVLRAGGTKFKTSIPVLQTTAVTFQKTKHNIAIGTATGKLILYNVHSGTIIPSDHEVLTPVTYLDFNSTDTQMAVGGKNGKIVLFSKFKLSSCMLMPECTELTAMRFHKEFNQLATGGGDGIVNIWDTQVGSTVFCNSAHTSDIADLTFVPILSIVISVSKDYSCVMHDLRNNHSTIFSFVMPTPLTSVDFAPSKDFNFVLATEVGEIYMYDLRKMCTPIFQCREHSSRINNVRFQTQSVQCMSEEKLTEADGDKAKTQKSIIELYKTGDGKFMDPEDSLCGIYGNSTTCVKSETSELERQINGNASGVNATFDAKQFKEELLNEVRGIVDELQDDMMRCITDLRLYCTKEFMLLENLIDTNFKMSQNSPDEQKNAEKMYTQYSKRWAQSESIATPSRVDCNEKVQMGHLFKRMSN